MRKRAYLVLVLVLLAVAAAGAAYYRHRVHAAAADCATPAPPEKPATPPPNLPGFQTEQACGPGEPPAQRTRAAPGRGAKKQK